MNTDKQRAAKLPPPAIRPNGGPIPLMELLDFAQLHDLEIVCRIGNMIVLRPKKEGPMVEMVKQLAKIGE